MRSMTGFGSGEARSESLKVTVEMSSVNRKQADIQVNLPRAIAELEPEVRRAISRVVSRGRVTVFIKLDPLGTAIASLRVNDHLATEYFQAMKMLSQIWGTPVELRPGELLRAQGVFEVRDFEPSVEMVEPLLEDALSDAFNELLAMQEQEGESLLEDLRVRLGRLCRLREAIGEMAPGVRANYREQMRKRLEESGLRLPIDDERLLKEMAIFAERCDISEELTRLRSHFEQFERYFDSAEAKGRALDFLCQEVNRELNTIGSKANDAGIAHHVVEAKTELEKIREQVQNVQ